MIAGSSPATRTKQQVSSGRRVVAGTGLISQRIVSHPQFESESEHHCYQLIEKIMQPHQQRVVDEFTELEIKLDALNNFIDTNKMFPTLNSEEQERLRQQAYAMRLYSDILAERIAAF